MPSNVPSLIYKLSLGDWERIAYHTVATESTFLGPPSGLCSLSLVSRQIHHAISVKQNSRLYSRIFRFKFDLAAPARRLSERWLTSRCLASELIKRFTTLRRIRFKRELGLDDLWTCYLMMSESDGKNESQLLNWAGMGSYLQAYVIFQMRSPTTWYADARSHSLVLWLFWMTFSRNNIQGEQMGFNESIIQMLHPFIVMGSQMASTYSPDSYFDLPICLKTTTLLPHCSGPQPPITEIVHYSHKLLLGAPVATAAATLITTVRTEALQDVEPLPEATQLVPRDRASANSLGIRGPTQEDIIAYHVLERIHVPDHDALPSIDSGFDPCDLDAEDLNKEPSHTALKGSARYDEDWSRLVACHNPWMGSTPLRGKMFSLGSLVGTWEGRMLIPDFDPYLRLIINSRQSPFSVPLHHQPLYWTLKEHHCLHLDDLLSTGAGDMEDDDFLNAWLPRGATISHLDDAIAVFDPMTGKTIRYETYNPRSMAHYSKSACERIETSWTSDNYSQDTLGNDTTSDFGMGNTDSVSSMAYIDDDDEYEDEVRHKSSGVCDVLITGEVGARRGDAWGHFTIVGRVRPWDGLIVLLRIPHDPNQEHGGRWVFRGYVHDRNFVGRWRETATDVGLVGFGGAFVVSKQGT